MKRLLLLLTPLLYLWTPMFASANTLTEKLDWYVEIINTLEASKQDTILIALLNLEKDTSKKILKSLIGYLLNAIEIDDPDATSKHIDRELYNTYAIPKDLSYTYDFHTHEKPLRGNWSNIILNPRIWWSSGRWWRWEVEWTTRYQTSIPQITLQWDVRTDVEYVEVIRDGDGESYFLEKYEPWSQEFTYGIDKKYGNIKNGVNNYLVRTYTKSRMFQSIYSLTYIDSENDSVYGEKIVDREETISTEREKKRADECYPTKDDLEKMRCFERIEKEYTISKQQACAMDDGSYAYALEATRPWKKVLVSSFVKQWDSLTYPVYTIDDVATDWSPSCEAESFQWSVFTYDCTTEKSLELYSSQLDKTTRMWACGIGILSENERYLLYIRRPYERHCGMYEWLSLLDKKTGESRNIGLFNEKSASWATTNLQTRQKMKGIASEYRKIDECFGPWLVWWEFTSDRLVSLEFHVATIDTKEVRYEVIYDVVEWKFIY